MISPQRAHREAPQRAFLVERYISPAAAVSLAGATAHAAELCARSHDVHYLYSVYLPTEDTCFCLFRAQSPDAVHALNDHANFALDRITEVELLVCSSVEPPQRRRPS